MPGGQSSRRAPHDEIPLQSTRQVSSMHPPVQTSGHFVGLVVDPVGHIGGFVSAGGGVSGFATLVSPGVDALSSVDVVESSLVDVAVSPSSVAVESPSGSLNTDAASEPPHPVAMTKTRQSATRIAK